MEVQGVKKRKKLYSFFKAKDHTSTNGENSQSNDDISNRNDQCLSESQRVETNVGFLERDPGIRTPISQYLVNQRDEVRRAYISLGPFQPNRKYPATKFGTQNRRFQRSWFKQFKWLEYSPEKDAAFCLPCFLFENNSECYQTFTSVGYKNWKKINDGERCGFFRHMGGLNSPHNNSMKSIDDLKDVTRHIDKALNAQSQEDKQKHRLRLRATIESIRWLSLQGCALRGSDESLSSHNRGNLIELIKLLGRMNPNIESIVLENAPGNIKYTSPPIQKDILHILANRVRTKIREEMGDAKFCILVDEAKDISSKEQMAIVLRFVDVSDFIRERFFEIVHVGDTSAMTLKKEISNILTRYDLDICDMRGQGYDGAGNMSGVWNGLQALFLRDCPYAYHVHCFADRLQLALVRAAENETSMWLFFSKLAAIVNIFSGSAKRHTQLCDAYALEMAHMVATGERKTGTGANQNRNLQRAGKTCWSSHYDSICSMIDMYGAVITVLENIMDERSSNVRGEACGCLIVMKSFDFVFSLFLMHKVRGITNLLCVELQKKSLDILNAMDFVSSSKALFQKVRENEFGDVLKLAKSLCEKHGIEIPNMDACHKPVKSRQCQQNGSITVEHHYHFDVFHAVIDFQMMELNNRFSDEAVELLKLSSVLESKESFKSFDIDHIYSLADTFYPNDFTGQEMHYLRSELEHYEVNIVQNERFQNLSTISELCQKLAETNKAQTYSLIDRLIRLVLTLHVSTATTERAFSAMKLVKTVLRNKMEDDFLSNSMVVYIERELAENIDIDSVIDEFYSMKSRRGQLL